MTQVPLEVTNFFLAMQAGPNGFGLIANLFAEEAAYSEPFSGAAKPHIGRGAIIAAFEATRSDAFDDAVISLGDVEIDGEMVTVHWTCISKAIPGGRGSGTNVFRLRDGLILSLTTTLDKNE